VPEADVPRIAAQKVPALGQGCIHEDREKEGEEEKGRPHKGEGNEERHDENED